MLRHIEVMHGIAQIGEAAWQSCHQQFKLPSSVECLQDGAFQGCYALRQVSVPGCVKFGRRVFAECSLSMIGEGQSTASGTDCAFCLRKLPCLNVS